MLSSAAALLLLTSTTPSSTPEGVFEAFAEVCLINLGDASKQVSVAQDKYGAKLVSEDADEGVDLRSEAFAFNVIDSDAGCAVTSSVVGSVTFEGMTTLIGEALGGAAPNDFIAPDTAYWLIAPEGVEGNFSISLLVSSETGQNLATLMISRVKGPIE
jgi:hypothetical protein